MILPIAAPSLDALLHHHHHEHCDASTTGDQHFHEDQDLCLVLGHQVAPYFFFQALSSPCCVRSLTFAAASFLPKWYSRLHRKFPLLRGPPFQV